MLFVLLAFLALLVHTYEPVISTCKSASRESTSSAP